MKQRPKKIFLDTNVWLRFLVADEPTQFEVVQTLFEAIERGEFLPYTSSIVMLEIYYVLTKVYGLKKPKALRFLNSLLKMRGLTIIKQADIIQAIKLHKKVKIKLSDCLIIVNVPRDIVFVTWDREFRKIKDRVVLVPDILV